MKGKQMTDNAHPDLGPTSVAMDFAQGIPEKTGNLFDLSIEGDGFFALQNKNGTTYTRNGSFILNKQNELVTHSGEYVLGETGKIIINGTDINIDSDGTVEVDGNIAGKLKIVSFTNQNELTRTMGGQYIDEGKARQKKADSYRISNGYLEMSNVSAAKEMIDMIDIQHTFETYQKIILTMSDLDKISTSRIGVLS
jgi:flagellar basal-body rod protein FlgG